MGPRCSSAETQVCHRSYIIAASERGNFFFKFLVFSAFPPLPGYLPNNYTSRDACNKICKTLSVARFIAKSYLPFLPLTEMLVTKFVKRYQLCVLCNIIR
jgi:hypothetical protein